MPSALKGLNWADTGGPFSEKTPRFVQIDQSGIYILRPRYIWKQRPRSRPHRCADREYRPESLHI